jgi:hypothetical protein
MRPFLLFALILTGVGYLVAPASALPLHRLDQLTAGSSRTTKESSSPPTSINPSSNGSFSNLTNSLLLLDTTAPLTATVYLPLVQLQIPRPYLLPQNTVEVVQAKTYCFLGNVRSTFCWIVGEVMNTTQVPVYNVEVQQPLCDAQGVVRTDTAYTFFAEIAPGQISSFRLATFVNYVDGILLCGQVNVRRWSSASSDTIQSVTVVTQTALPVLDEYSNEIIDILATLRNDTTWSLSPTVAAVTLYDRDGAILDTQAVAVAGRLEPGTTVAVDVAFQGWQWDQYTSGQIAYYTVYAQGVAAAQSANPPPHPRPLGRGGDAAGEAVTFLAIRR